MTYPFALIDHMQERLTQLKEQLRERERFGVNAPGFNQTLGALDELQELIRFVTEKRVYQTTTKLDDLHRVLLGIRAAAQLDALDAPSVIAQVNEALAHFHALAATAA